MIKLRSKDALAGRTVVRRKSRLRQSVVIKRRITGKKRALGLAAEDPNFTHDRNGSGARRPVQRHPHLPAPGHGQSGLESADDGEALRPDVKQVAHPDTQGDLAVKVLIEDVEALRVSDGLFLDRAVSQG